MKIKLHVFRGPNDGTVDCDFRGAKFIGHNEGDEHRTITEIDNITDSVAEVFLKYGPQANKALALLKTAEPAFAGDLATTLGLAGEGDPGLRLGLFDDHDVEPSAS